MTFQVGQKIECVRNDFLIYGNEVLPVVRSIYHVRSIQLEDDNYYLRVREISNVPRAYSNGFLECAFASIAFRPLVERSTDAGFAILKKLEIPNVRVKKRERLEPVYDVADAIRELGRLARLYGTGKS